MAATVLRRSSARRSISPSIIARIILCVFSSLIVASSAIQAQSPTPFSSAESSGMGTIQGRVVNASNESFLNNARVNVAVSGVNRETYSNLNGEYRLTNVPAGTAVVTVAVVGMETKTANVQVQAGTSAQQDFSLRLERGDGETASGVQVLEQFTVTDRVMTGQAVAMHEQRAAPNVKNVISLDEVGEMAEGNVGEYLKYVPGFSAVYNGGAGVQFVTMRGMPSTGTQVMLDGVTATSPSGGRSFEFGVAVTGNVDRLEVVKTPTPDMPANAVGGSINIITKGGLGRKKAAFSYNTFLTYSAFDGFEGLKPKFKAIAGPDRTGGEMFHGSTNYDVNPNYELSYFMPIKDTLALTLTTSRTLRTGDWIFQTPTWNRATGVQTQFQSNVVLQGAGVDFLSGKVEWQATRNDEIAFNFTKSNRESFTRQHILITNPGAGATGGEAFSQGTAAGVGVATMSLAANTQGRVLDHYVLSHRHDGETWKLDSNVAYSAGGYIIKNVEDGFFTSVGATMTGLVLRNEGFGGINDRRIPVTTATQGGTPVDIYNSRNYTLNTVGSAPRYIDTDAIRASINLSRPKLFGLPLDAKIGAVYDRTEIDDRSGSKTWAFTPPGGTAARLASNYNVFADEFSKRWSYTNSAGAEISPTFLSSQAMFDLYKQKPEWFILDETAAYTNEVNGRTKLNETIEAGYIRFDSRLINNRLWLVGGVRYERSTVDGRGPRNDISATYVKNPDGTLARNSAGALIPITTDPLARAKLQYTKLGLYRKKSQDGYYPSMNASYSLSDKIVMRVAYASTIGRPDIPNLTLTSSITDPASATAEKIITVSNPGLKPWTANNYDFTLEAYDIKHATMSVSLFQKDLKGFFSTQRAPSTSAVLSELGYTDEFLPYDIQTTVNGGSATVKGMELAYRQTFDFGFMPKWARGLQFFINLTELRISGKDADNFTEYSPEELSWGVGYGIGKFYFRSNTVSTDPVRRRVITAATATADTVYEYRLPFMRSDLSAEYQLSKKFIIYTTVRNLQSAAIRNDRYNSQTPRYTRPTNYQFGLTDFAFGVRGEF